VLILRGRLEGVEGSDERIPFIDLPRLGGPTLLRGYARDRFRDRVALLASLEYRYPIWRQVSGFLFADAGRVLPDLSEAGRAALAPQLLRPSGGAGLEVFQVDSVLVRGQVAGSPEGVFFQFSLGPVYGLPTHNYRI
jgi:outer membrane protein assembly factor BamA